MHKQLVSWLLAITDQLCYAMHCKAFTRAEWSKFYSKHSAEKKDKKYTRLWTPSITFDILQNARSNLFSLGYNNSLGLT